MHMYIYLNLWFLHFSTYVYRDDIFIYVCLCIYFCLFCGFTSHIHVLLLCISHDASHRTDGPGTPPSRWFNSWCFFWVPEALEGTNLKFQGCRFVPYTCSETSRHSSCCCGYKYWWNQGWRLDSGPYIYNPAVFSLPICCICLTMFLVAFGVQSLGKTNQLTETENGWKWNLSWNLCVSFRWWKPFLHDYISDNMTGSLLGGCPPN